MQPAGVFRPPPVGPKTESRFRSTIATGPAAAANNLSGGSNYRVTSEPGAGRGSYAKHIRARRTSVPSIPQPQVAQALRKVTPAHTAEQADPDLEFVALATASGVDLGSEEYLHDILYETILSPLPRPWVSAVGGSAGVYYRNEVTGATTPKHPMLSTLQHTIEGRRRAYNEQQAAPHASPVGRSNRSSTSEGGGGGASATPAAPANPAGRPNRSSGAAGGTGLGSIMEEPEPEPEPLVPRSEADIFGEFFNAPATAETINGPEPGPDGAGGPVREQPLFAPAPSEAEAEEELTHFLDEPSPPKKEALPEVTEEEMNELFDL